MKVVSTGEVINMSYDLSVHLKSKNLNDNIISEWLAEIRKLNMDVEVYPDFLFSHHSGYLPFKVSIYDCPNSNFNNIELLSGFELFVNPYKYKNKKKSIISRILYKQKELSSIERKLKKSDTEIIIYISVQDSFEYRLGWYCAASLAKICDGILTDLQEGIQLESQQAIKYAYEQVIQLEKLIKDDEWRIYEFKEWIG